MTLTSIEVNKTHPQIAIVTLNRPDKRNALNIALMEELCSVLDDLQHHGFRVVIIAANGSVFSAGLDLNEGADPALIESLAAHISRALTTLCTTSLVTIAAVNGDALAGGAGLAAACDLVVMLKGAHIGFPEVRRGLVAALVSAVLAQQISVRDMRELMLTGESVDAQRAQGMGLVNFVVDDDALKGAVNIAEKVLKGGPEAVKLSKRLISDLNGQKFMENIQHALALHHSVRHSKEAQEGIAAFSDKRNPLWIE